MKPGLNLWTILGFTYSGVPALDEAVRIAKDLGYEGVEVVFDDGPLAPQRIDRELRRRILEVGVEVPSVATGVFWKYNLGSPDSYERERAIEYAKMGLDLARDLDARVLLVVPGVAKPEIPYEELYERSRDSLKELAKYAEDLGVIIGVENVWNKFLYSPLEFRNFLDDVGSDYVKAYFDVGNVVALGYHEHWTRLLKGRIAMVHVKDFDIEVGSIRGFRHIGRGSIEWGKVVRLLREADYDDFLIVECPPEFYPELEKPRYPEDGIRAAKDNLEALKKILGIS
ncbi:MAG: sugar phosphate isomerase/epimerase [Thermoprotei archaeon]|nr:MAG: sugar phosphate isomerase/epimerase [Thermoprotei archaeon]